MKLHDQRTLILRALLLDGLGQLLIMWLMLLIPSWFGLSLGAFSFEGQSIWLIFLFILYPLMGWLFGAFTVLSWRQLTFLVLLQRLLITAVVTVMILAIVRWLFNTDETVWLLYRRVQLSWMTLITGWALVIRLALRRGLLLPESPRLVLIAQPEEVESVLRAWRRVPGRLPLTPTSVSRLRWYLNHLEYPLLVAMSSSFSLDVGQRELIESLELQDPRIVRCVSLLSLFEHYQERCPPLLLGNSVINFDDLPCVAPFSVQSQLKRVADVLLAALLLLLLSPIIAFASLLIWLEDNGPVFYLQRRSGWLGREFTVYKLRTMSVQPSDSPAEWTQLGDQRITRIGGFLRRVRLDELPQLLNVLSGEMSLIGPRPERPELECRLERNIPNYRKRHLMRPGLSGWAQVCAPYASTIEDSDLKLSYDLYYLRHFNTWLDFVILFRTVKTVLKAGGR